MKFNPNTYNPTTDSSPSYTGTAHDLHLVIEEGQCQCGCELQSNKGKRFRQGHDAKLKGKLIRAYLAGYDVLRTQGGITVGDSALNYAGQYNWTSYLERAAAKNSAAPTPTSYTIKIAGGREVQARHIDTTPTGKLVLEYMTAAGETRTVTRNAA